MFCRLRRTKRTAKTMDMTPIVHTSKIISKVVSFWRQPSEEVVVSLCAPTVGTAVVEDVDVAVLVEEVCVDVVDVVAVAVVSVVLVTSVTKKAFPPLGTRVCPLNDTTSVADWLATAITEGTMSRPFGSPKKGWSTRKSTRKAVLDTGTTLREWTRAVKTPSIAASCVATALPSTALSTGVGAIELTWVPGENKRNAETRKRSSGERGKHTEPFPIYSVKHVHVTVFGVVPFAQVDLFTAHPPWLVAQFVHAGIAHNRTSDSSGHCLVRTCVPAVSPHDGLQSEKADHGVRCNGEVLHCVVGSVADTRTRNPKAAVRGSAPRTSVSLEVPLPRPTS
mmetsp:Transcript_14054/g.36228  ORF Transcript_14054/g.36228 Transcript_14054/m.36228 type:complete len:336 (-) Transcript_14054:2654-3661(-)